MKRLTIEEIEERSLKNRKSCNDHRKSFGLESIPLNPEEYERDYCDVDPCVKGCPLETLVASLMDDGVEIVNG